MTRGEAVVPVERVLHVTPPSVENWWPVIGSPPSLPAVKVTVS